MQALCQLMQKSEIIIVVFCFCQKEFAECVQQRYNSKLHIDSNHTLKAQKSIRFLVSIWVASDLHICIFNLLFLAIKWCPITAKKSMSLHRFWSRPMTRNWRPFALYSTEQHAQYMYEYLWDKCIHLFIHLTFFKPPLWVHSCFVNTLFTSDYFAILKWMLILTSEIYKLMNAHLVCWFAQWVLIKCPSKDLKENKFKIKTWMYMY